MQREETVSFRYRETGMCPFCRLTCTYYYLSVVVVIDVFLPVSPDNYHTRERVGAKGEAGLAAAAAVRVVYIYIHI